MKGKDAKMSQRTQSADVSQIAVRQFFRLILRRNTAIPIGIALALGAAAIAFFWQNQHQAQVIVAGKPGDYLLCFWNVENFFDDRDDRRRAADDEYDNWFAHNPADLRQKLGKITEVVLALNGGKGPDILALAEVENRRAAKLLMDALNAGIADPAYHYKHILMKEVHVGRNIAPAIITRVGVVADKTKQLGRKKQRIVRGHLTLNGKQLVVVASHWTSRLNGGEKGRAEYADDIFGEFQAMYRTNPKVDFLVCGDFNDGPDDVSVTGHLRATGDAVSPGDLRRPPIVLFDLLAGKNPARFGTLYHSGWHIFDHVCVSPGMLDNEGWSVNAKSITTIKNVKTADGRSLNLVDAASRTKRPWHFGRQTDDPARRGYSDHFPVAVTLTLHDEADRQKK